MLRQENDLLSRVGPGTQMGQFMRQFWIPAIPSSVLVKDGAPMRLRLLGEDLVAFRATDGRVGLLDERCPHRGVSLALARNRDCALQCIFHGWKIDVTGKLVDVPAEPKEKRAEFAARVKVRHFPVREGGGIVWAWLGGGEPGPFPAFNWTSLPPTHVRIAVGIIKASWLNGLEGQLDSAHVGILHQDWASKDPGRRTNVDNTLLDLAPRFEFEEQPYGYREAAIRSMPDGKNYVRIREFVMPWYSYIPQGGGRGAIQLLTISVPVDDEHSAQWDIRYTLEHPLDFGGSTHPIDAYISREHDTYQDMTPVLGTIDNRFGQERDRMENGAWSGFPMLRNEDYAVAMAQGAIADRTIEHLATSDISIVRARRALLSAVHRHAGGQNAPCFDPAIKWNLIRSFAETMSPGQDWRTLPRG
jgi:phthalate 4,5-dioxygenase oxygenase subunit